MYNSRSTFCYNRIPFWSHGFLLLLSRHQSEVWTDIYNCGYVYTYVSLRGNLLTHANNITVFLVTFIFINVMQKTLEWSNVTVTLGEKLASFLRRGEVVLSGGAPTPAGTSMLTIWKNCTHMKCEVKHNGDMRMGHLWLNGWGIYGL